MQEREAVEKRQTFEWAAKKQIFWKSDWRCAHCGRRLEYGVSSVEHVIPLDKGGTNDFSNLVGLCIDCNKGKDNLIVHPRDYYKYLKPEFLDELMTSQKEYYKDFKWFTRTSFMPEDIKVLTIPLIVKGLRRNKTIDTIGIQYITVKAESTDYKNIVEFLVKYHKKFTKDKNINKAFLMRYVRLYLERGCIYLIYNNNELKGVIPMRVAFTTEELGVDAPPNYVGTITVVDGVYVLYDKSQLHLAAVECLVHILSRIEEICDYNKIFSACVRMNNNKFRFDLALRDVFKRNAVDFHEVDNYFFFTVTDGSKRDFQRSMIRGFSTHLRQMLGISNDSKPDMAFSRLGTCENPIVEVRISDLKLPDDVNLDAVYLTPYMVERFKAGALAPLEIDQWMILRGGYEEYVYYLQAGVSTCECEVFGSITRDIRELDINSGHYMPPVQISSDDYYELTVDIKDLKRKSKGEVHISVLRKKQFRSNSLPCIDISEDLTIVKGEDIYMLLKQSGAKQVKCRVVQKKVL